MMKRILAAALAAALTFAYWSAFAEDTEFESRAELLEALREAGRETENILARDVYPRGDTPEAAVFLVRAGDTAQLTAVLYPAGATGEIIRGGLCDPKTILNELLPMTKPKTEKNVALAK